MAQERPMTDTGTGEVNDGLNTVALANCDTSEGITTNQDRPRLSRPDRFDGCYNCAKRFGDKCKKYPHGIRGLSGMKPCEFWMLSDHVKERGR
jgi:hypothetical protein